MGNGDLLKPLRGLSIGSATSTQLNTNSTARDHQSQFIKVKTIADVERYVSQANAQGKSVMLDFFAVSCTACYEFADRVFPDVNVVKALSNAVLIQADVTANDDEDKALLKHFAVHGLPSILFFDKNGYEDKRLRAVGYEDADIFVQRIDAAFTANL